MRRLGLLFPGQGTQFVGMGRDLACPAARRVFEEVDEALGQSLSRLMLDGPEAELMQTRNTQPALLAHSIAALRAADGGEAALAMGHSVGEYSALVAAGALGLGEAARLLRLRGEAMQRAADAAGPHAMVALLPATRPAAEACVRAAAAETGLVVDVAGVNSAAQVVISGAAAAVARAVEIGKAEHGVRRGMALRVSAPFHCALLAPAAEELAAALPERLAPLRFPVVSNVTARPETDPAAWPALLVQQVVAPVNWLGSMEAADPLCDEFREFGPGEVLSGLVGKALGAERVR